MESDRMTNRNPKSTKLGRRIPAIDRSGCCSDGETCCKDLLTFDIKSDDRERSDDAEDV